MHPPVRYRAFQSCPLFSCLDDVPFCIVHGFSPIQKRAVFSFLDMKLLLTLKSTLIFNCVSGPGIKYKQKSSQAH